MGHAGDAFAFDIFSQAGKAVRGKGPINPLGPLKARRVLAAAESQSSLYLTTYVDAVDPLAKVYEAFARFAPR